MISLCTVLSRKYILLLDHPQANYQLKITASQCLIDVKGDIFSITPVIRGNSRKMIKLHTSLDQNKLVSNQAASSIHKFHDSYQPCHCLYNSSSKLLSSQIECSTYLSHPKHTTYNYSKRGSQSAQHIHNTQNTERMQDFQGAAEHN